MRIHYRYFRVIRQTPLTGERQAQSIVLAALYWVADAAFTDQPVPRRKGKRTAAVSQIDYWVYFWDSVILLELQLAWLRATRPLAVTQAVRSSWQSSCDQLQRVSQADVEGLATTRDRVLKISLLLVPTYQWAYQPGEFEIFDQTAVLQTHDALAAELPAAAPNWSAAWIPHPDLQRAKGDYDDATWHEQYPYTGLFAHVSSI
jgi:hypothetical protein